MPWPWNKTSTPYTSQVYIRKKKKQEQGGRWLYGVEYRDKAETGTNSSARAFVTTYNDQAVYDSMLRLGKSHSDTLGTLTSTMDTEELGTLAWWGVNSSNAWAYGAWIMATQVGAAGTTLAANLEFGTYKSDGNANTSQFF